MNTDLANETAAEAPTPGPPPSPAEQAERALVSEAIRKIGRGGTPAAQELAALKRWEKRKEEDARWRYYRSVPAKHYKEMSGRGARVLIDQAATWGMPVSGAVIDLTAVVRWMHDFIADNSRRLREADGEVTAKDELERYRRVNADLAEIQLQSIRRERIPADDVRAVVGYAAACLVRCLTNLENSISMEFATWIADPQIQAMPSEQRSLKVREFVARTCAEVRRFEAKGLDELLREVADDGGGDAGNGDG